MPICDSQFRPRARERDWFGFRYERVQRIDRPLPLWGHSFRLGVHGATDPVFATALGQVTDTPSPSIETCGHADSWEPPVFVRDRSGDTPCPWSRQLSKNRRPIRGGARGGYTRGLSENGNPRSGPPCPWSSAPPPGKNLGDFRAAHVRCPARGLGGFAESLGRTTGFPSESPWIAPCGLVGGSGGRNQWSPPAAGSGECPAAVVAGEVVITPVSCSSTSPAGSAKSGSRLPRGCPERFLGNRPPQRRGTKSPVFVGQNGKLGN